jgi:hypothetical protein
MKAILPVLVLFMFAGCAKKSSEEQAGTASRSAYSEVIDQNQGYVVEDARFAQDGDTAPLVMDGGLKLAKGTGSVVVIRGVGGDGASTILALQIASFAPGSSVEYGGEAGSAQFWVAGTVGGSAVRKETGLVSGNIRMIKDEWSDLDLGLNRSIRRGVGDLEVVVANIDPAGLNLPREKKYAARFQLPIVTLDELVRISRPV